MEYIKRVVATWCRVAGVVDHSLIHKSEKDKEIEKTRDAYLQIDNISMTVTVSQLLVPSFLYIIRTTTTLSAQEQMEKNQRTYQVQSPIRVQTGPASSLWPHHLRSRHNKTSWYAKQNRWQWIDEHALTRINHLTRSWGMGHLDELRMGHMS